jgi:hypothetical protein
MPRAIRFAAVTALSACLATATVTLHAQDAAKPAAAAAAAPAEEGFTPLFNGKDLTGWVYGTKKERPAKGKAKDKAAKDAPAKGASEQAVENKDGKGYQVKEGGVLYSTKEDGGHLFTEKEYADFVLRFEFKLTPNANNGIGIRAPLTGDAAYAGMEVQVLDDSGDKYAGKLKPGQTHGSVYLVFPAKPGSLKPVGEWNTEEIRVQGTKITVTVNGQVTVDADTADVKDEEILKKHPGLKNKKGHIGLLGHGAEVEFRNLRVKEL